MAKEAPSVQDQKDTQESQDASTQPPAETSPGTTPETTVAARDATTDAIAQDAAPSAAASAVAPPQAVPPAALVDDRVIVGAVLMNARFYRRGDERALARAMHGRSLAHLVAARVIRGDWSDRPEDTPDPAADKTSAARRTTSRHRRRR